VKSAASDLKKQIIEIIARRLNKPVEELEMENKGVVVKSDPSKSLSFEAAIIACREEGTGVELLGKGYYDPPTELLNFYTGYGNYSITYPFGATVAEVEVDTDTGIVTVKKLTAAYDVGKALNPMSVEGQIEGASAMGLGYAISEKVIWENGKFVNDNFKDYRLPGAADVPPVESLLIEPIDPDGPFGAKGMAEAALVPMAPAIANAVYDAIGVRITELPITPEKILRSLGKL
jgi:CO/xanthine dehydrogenase Mo-binding subunit